jgi:hypothetical protein
MIMSVALQSIAGDGVEHAAAQEGRANQDVENVEHDDAFGSASAPRHAAGMLRRTQIGFDPV